MTNPSFPFPPSMPNTPAAPAQPATPAIPAVPAPPAQTQMPTQPAFPAAPQVPSVPAQPTAPPVQAPMPAQPAFPGAPAAPGSPAVSPLAPNHGPIVTGLAALPQVDWSKSVSPNFMRLTQADVGDYLLEVQSHGAEISAIQRLQMWKISFKVIQSQSPSLGKNQHVEHAIILNRFPDYYIEGVKFFLSAALGSVHKQTVLPNQITENYVEDATVNTERYKGVLVCARVHQRIDKKTRMPAVDKEGRPAYDVIFTPYMGEVEEASF